MIRLGICTDLKNAGILAGAGFDYIETAMNAVAAMSAGEFAHARDELSRAGIPCEAMNCMLPGSIRLTGPKADIAGIEAYLSAAFSRAGELGVKVAVFGSGESRRVPEGFSPAEAQSQLRDFLILADRLAGENGLNIAIEPLRHAESNVLNRVSEAKELAAKLNLPHVGVLGDTYHMDSEGEPLEALARAGGLLWHIHMARPQSRLYPLPGDGAEGEYHRLFQLLKKMNYSGRVSIEGRTASLSEDARRSFALLDGLRQS